MPEKGPSKKGCPKLSLLSSTHTREKRENTKATQTSLSVETQNFATCTVGNRLFYEGLLLNGGDSATSYRQRRNGASRTGSKKGGALEVPLNAVAFRGMVHRARGQKGKKKGGGGRFSGYGTFSSAALLFPPLSPGGAHHSASERSERAESPPCKNTVETHGRASLQIP